MNLRNLIVLLFLCLPFSFSMADTSSPGLFDDFGLGDDANEFLEPDKAFAFSAEVIDANTVITRWEIADGYYLYRERFKFNIENDNVTLGNIVFPAGEKKHDQYFGEMEIYHHNVEANISLQRKNASPEKIILTVEYQGCKENSICYLYRYCVRRYL